MHVPAHILSKAMIDRIMFLEKAAKLFGCSTLVRVDEGRAVNLRFDYRTQIVRVDGRNGMGANGLLGVGHEISLYSSRTVSWNLV
jgi:hypothetical protein